MVANSRWVWVICLIGVLYGCTTDINEPTSSAPELSPTRFNSAGAPTVVFSLPDMMCEDGCAVAVKDILEKQPGVRDVRVDFEAKTATVAVDEAAFSSERTLAELVDKGFDNSELAGESSTSDEATAAEASTAEIE